MEHASGLRAYPARRFGVDDVVAAKAGRTVSVCIPARNEAATVGAIVVAIRRACMERAPVVDELVVVDDRSTDATAAMAAAGGAVVVPAADVLPRVCAQRAGKGQAMWKGLSATSGDVVVFLDADVRNFDPRTVTGLLGPLLTEPPGRFALAKARYVRPLDGRPGEGGRVTELVARPLIALLHPALAAVVQPLSGEIAAPRAVLERIPFSHGYGVDLGILIDVALRHGVQAVCEVDLGTRLHRNRTLAELGPQAMEVLHVALRRAGLPLAQEGVAMLRPGVPAEPVAVWDCPPLVEVPAYGARRALAPNHAPG